MVWRSAHTIGIAHSNAIEPNPAPPTPVDGRTKSTLMHNLVRDPMKSMKSEVRQSANGERLGEDRAV